VPALDAKDHRACLDFLWFAREGEGADAFPEPVLAQLRGLVAGARAAPESAPE
jgi:hypothetical protein